MSVSTTSLEQARAHRATLRAAADRAALCWQDAVLDAVAALAVHAGAAGQDAVAVFRGSITPSVDGEVFDDREGLLSVTLASDRGRVALSTCDGPRWQWAEAVDLWAELRAALAKCYATDVPVSIVLDLEQRIVFGYEPLHCPDIGPEPDLTLELDDAAAADRDPFADLLACVDYDPTATDARRDELLERYRLTPPTAPAHGPGECDEAWGVEDGL